MEGTPLRTSAVKRTALPRVRAAAELGEVDAGCDANGNAHQAGETRMMPEPTMEFAMPPPCSPTGAGM